MPRKWPMHTCTLYILASLPRLLHRRSSLSKRLERLATVCRAQEGPAALIPGEV